MVRAAINASLAIELHPLHSSPVSESVAPTHILATRHLVEKSARARSARQARRSPFAFVHADNLGRVTIELPFDEVPVNGVSLVVAKPREVRMMDADGEEPTCRLTIVN